MSNVIFINPAAWGNYHNLYTSLPQELNPPTFVEFSKYQQYILLTDKQFDRSTATLLEKEIFDFFNLITCMDEKAFEQAAPKKFEIFDRLDIANRRILYSNCHALAMTLAVHKPAKKNEMSAIRFLIKNKYDEEATFFQTKRVFNASTPEAIEVERLLSKKTAPASKREPKKSGGSIWRTGLKLALVAGALFALYQGGQTVSEMWEASAEVVKNKYEGFPLCIDPFECPIDAVFQNEYATRAVAHASKILGQNNLPTEVLGVLSSGSYGGKSHADFRVCTNTELYGFYPRDAWFVYRPKDLNNLSITDCYLLDGANSDRASGAARIFFTNCSIKDNKYEADSFNEYRNKFKENEPAIRSLAESILTKGYRVSNYFLNNIGLLEGYRRDIARACQRHETPLKRLVLETQEPKDI